MKAISEKGLSVSQLLQFVVINAEEVPPLLRVLNSEHRLSGELLLR